MRAKVGRATGAARSGDLGGLGGVGVACRLGTVIELPSKPSPRAEVDVGAEIALRVLPELSVSGIAFSRS